MPRTLPAPDRPIPIDMRGVRSGYVYVAHSPDRPGSCKVGHTTRPPHVRVEELGKTTWLSPMRAFSARFFWDALTVEREVHRALQGFKQEGTEEWFHVPASQVASMVGGWKEPDRPRSPCRDAPAQLADPLWLQERMDWAVEDVASPLKIRVACGWRDIERLSCLGHAPASWLLSEKILLENPLEPERALWVLDAASRQGYRGATLRKEWLGSLTMADPTRRRWKESASSFLGNAPDPERWCQEDRETFEHEVRLWRRQPSLAWHQDLADLLARS